MEQSVAELLRAWEAFYVIIGPSAAVLIGLQFVVIVLSAEMNLPGSGSTTGVFATPTIIHFGVVLLVSASLCAPWPSLTGVDVTFGVCGVAGLIYSALVVRRARRQTIYTPVLEDWVWHCILPLLSYAALLIAAVMLVSAPMPSLFVVGATMLLMLFIGLHNAWDAVVYIAYRDRGGQQEEHE